MLTLFSVSSLSLFSTGTNYSFVRFLTPSFGVLVVHRLLRPSNLKTHPAGIALIFPFSVLNLLISPEMGIIFATGAALYLIGFRQVRSTRDGLVFFGAVLGVVASVAVAVKAQEFATFFSFRSGGLNFPIVPAVSVLTFFAAIWIAAKRAGDEFFAESPSAVAALCCVALVSLPAALAGAIARISGGMASDGSFAQF